MRFTRTVRRRAFACAVFALFASTTADAQRLGAAEAEIDGSVTRTWTTADDHRNMMEQLGIWKLRPGRDPDRAAPNAANYDEALANPFPQLPDPLTMKDGRPVTSAEMWFRERRPEIVEDFEREVLGRIPANVPDVEWIVVETAEGFVGDRPVRGKRLVGRVDNSSYPELRVEIRMTLVTPADADAPVPVMMMFGGARSIPGGTEPEEGLGPRRFGPPPSAGPSDPPATEQLIRAGWGYAQIDPTSIQPDNGAGLTKGIIGLVNQGRPRKPDDWGALRAWAWGASRGLDYLETDPAVDATRVGIEGVSRYGKAALVAMAFDERFAVALVASSGEGGAKLHRRNFGEAVENLTAPSEYHWMAGNFLKYGAEEASFGSMNAGDLPVDAHQLIALCAPRPVFISYGVPERGDALWLDQQGSFMAAVAAGPVFRLLGAKDLGTSDDYMSEKMPPVNVGLLDGHLAWRQHDGGHTDGPNWKYFIPWASRLLGYTPRADRALMRIDPNSVQAHTQLVEKARSGRIDVYFVGDSITRRWGATDYPALLTHWRRSFRGWNAANFGWGGDTTQNILWRIENGELDGVNPKVIVLLAGTNNVGTALAAGREPDAADIARGIEAIVRAMQKRAPGAMIVLMALFPRNDFADANAVIADINRRIETLADGERVRFLDINDRLSQRNGRLRADMSLDGLHLTRRGYEAWAEALAPLLTEQLGPRDRRDRAPPPTGDPSAAGRAAR